MIFLGGGGSEEESFELDAAFLDGVEKILYLPIAMNSENYSGCKEWFTKAMSKHGNFDITIWNSVDGKTFADTEGFDAIYIGGGNTYKLLGELQTSGFTEVLKKFVVNKKLYGGSAGAIIIGKNISTAKGLDEEINIPSNEGLNLVNEYLIACHYKPEFDNKLKKLSINKKILALSEKSGLFVNKKIFGKIILFVNGEKSILQTPNLP